MIPTSYLATDLAAMIDDLPATFTLGALSFECSVTDLTQEQTLILTGTDGNEAISVIFPVTSLASSATALAPNLRVGVTRIGDSTARNYAIVSVQKSPDNVSYTLACKEDHRKPV